MMSQNLHDDIDHILISAEQIEQRIGELAADVKRDYAGKDDLLLLCVLKGAIMFMANFSLALDREHALEFMAVSSYMGGTKTSGVVKIVLDLNTNIEDRHVLIIEDIVDSGNTLNYLVDFLKARNPASIKICTLLDKPEGRQVEIDADYVGFIIPDEFVVGYGLDFDERYRNLPYIGVLKPRCYES